MKIGSTRSDASSAKGGYSPTRRCTSSPDRPWLRIQIFSKHCERGFKVTILDEMQDTQKQQDDLLNLLFPSDECTIQRFGDPDQSIFDQIGGGLPNTSYNDASLRCITESHRFVPSIASNLAGLSYRKAGPFTGSKIVPPGCPENTIFLFEEVSIGRVLPAFAKLARNLPLEHRSAVKAIGGIGKITGASSLALANYWPAYDAKPQPQSFRAKSSVRCCEILWPFARRRCCRSLSNPHNGCPGVDEARRETVHSKIGQDYRIQSCHAHRLPERER